MHIFAKKIPKQFAVELLSTPTIAKFLSEAERLAGTPEAVRIFELGEYKDYTHKGVPNYSPKFFGFAVEFFAEVFFKYHGALFNLHDIRSVSDFESVDEDRGVDHYAKSVKNQAFGGTSREAKPNSPVYIQTKGTLKPTREYSTNDGSRLMNFYGYANGLARSTGHCYQARFILFTTGKGLHYKLNENTHKEIEVVNRIHIRKLTDGNESFYNELRAACGVELVECELSRPDPEFECNMQNNQ